MLKICHIISGDLFAGAESVVLQLLQNLQSESQVDLFVILFNNGVLAGKIRESKLKYRIVSEEKLSFKKMVTICRMYLKEFQPDVVHSHNYKENLISVLSTRNMGVKRITTQHGLAEEYGGLKNFKNHVVLKLNLFVLKHYFNNVILVSSELKNIFLSRFKLPVEKLYVIHNGIKINKRRKKKNTNKEFIFGSAGRFVPIKNYSLYLQIANNLKETPTSVLFELIGEGPQEPILKEEMKRFELDSIFKILPFSDDLNEFYGHLNVYINTSNHEGIPLSVLEAMSNGLPVIAPRVGGLPEIIDHGIDGYLVDNSDPEEYGKYCLLFIGDSSLLEKMSQKARQKIKNKFSLSQMTNKYLKLYF